MFTDIVFGTLTLAHTAAKNSKLSAQVRGQLTEIRDEIDV